MSSSESARKRVAIIGAGVCGITTAKAVLEEDPVNIEVVVYERSKHTGGLWRFVDDEGGNAQEKKSGREDTATVMHSTVINSGKEVSAFSDFPPPSTAPNFMHNSQWMAYIDAYAASFNFARLVRLEHEVVSVRPSPTNEVDGSWTLLVKNYQNGNDDPPAAEEHFSAVYICTGHHGQKRMPPPLPGQTEHFTGEVVHAHDVKSGARFRGKRVIVVGLGNSGADLAAELGPIARQVYVSLKRGTWVSYRVGPFGRPMDHYFLRRAVQLLIDWLPLAIFSGLLHQLLNFRFDHRRYCLQPETLVLGQHITINDALPNLLISGRVVIKGRMVGFEEDGRSVLLEDGSKLEDIDAVIFATGYQMFSFPFLSASSGSPLASSLRTQSSPVSRIPLYQYVFSPHLPTAARHTLAFIGLVQPIGPIMNAAELQARWAVKLLCQPEKYQLPSKEAMLADIERKRVAQDGRFYPSDRHTISFDWLPYMDELAEMVGCRPPLLKLLFTDPRLWWALVFGCAGAYQYRLVGPNAWPRARETILRLEERIEAPFATRTNDDELKMKQGNGAVDTSGARFISLGLLFFLALYYLSLMISRAFAGC